MMIVSRAGSQYRRDPADRARFKREGSIISINGATFFDHLRGTGGGGAIGLVIHATGCRFPEALRFSRGPESRGRATATPAAPRAAPAAARAQGP